MVRDLSSSENPMAPNVLSASSEKAPERMMTGMMAAVTTSVPTDTATPQANAETPIAMKKGPVTAKEQQATIHARYNTLDIACIVCTWLIVVHWCLESQRQRLTTQC